MPQYDEKEIFDEILLCDSRGRLNPEAVAWSRKPLHVANMRGRWPGKKKWNHWVVTSDTFSFCASHSNVDYIGLAFVYFLDFETEELIEQTVVLPLGIGCNIPERVEDDIYFRNNKIEMGFKYRDGGLDIKTKSRAFGGGLLDANIAVEVPVDHESVNVVIPFDNGKYRFTSKQTALPASGNIRVGDKTYTCDPESTFASLDYNRSIIDYRTTWNWANGAGRQGDDLIGLNFGAKWCYGRGITQNGVCLNGKLHKVSEDVLFEFNRKNFMEPWTIRTEISDRVNLRITPFYEKVVDENFIILKTNVHQVYGHFSGTIVLDDGNTLEIENIMGWSEEQVALW